MAGMFLFLFFFFFGGGGEQLRVETEGFFWRGGMGLRFYGTIVCLK